MRLERLKKEQLREILLHESGPLKRRCKEYEWDDLELIVEDEVIDMIAEKAVKEDFGARSAFSIAAIYVFYSVIQILFLFMRLESGLPDGVTYSQYAHAGFWQLLLVSLINIVTVLICISVFQENKILKILLMVISICTCIMTLSAAYRMILYVNAYYLTFLRVLVLWFLGVLMLIMFGVMWSIIRRNFQLFRYIMVIVTVCYIGLSFSKVDRRVAEYNVEHWDFLFE